MLKKIVFLFFIFSTHAFAYVPPSQYMVNKLALKHNGYKGFKVKSEVMGMEFNQPTETKFKVVHIYHPEIQILRSKAVNDAGQTLYNTEKPMKFFTVLNQLQFQTDGIALAKALAEKNIPILLNEELQRIDSEEKKRSAEKTYLTRLKNIPVWAVGKKEKDTPQLWFEKDTFLPVKVAYQQGSNFLEIQFDTYRYFREFPYPRSIVFYKDGSGSLFKEDVIEVIVNPDIQEFKNNPLSESAGFTDAGNVLPTAQRDLIRQYYEYLR